MHPIFARSSDRTLVLGHRGAPAVAEDNTLASFAAALAAGADGVELDVRRSADGGWIVHHDPAIAGLDPVSEMDTASLRDAAPWVPTLDEAFGVLGESLVNIEIKNSPSEPNYDPDAGLAAEVCAWVVERDLSDRVIISSFDPGSVARISDLAPHIATGQLLTEDFDPIPLCGPLADAGRAAIHPALATISGARAAELVRMAHGLGVGVVVWTVNEPEDIRRLAAAGVDAIITDDPGRARATLE